MNAIRFAPRQGRVQAILRRPGTELELEVADEGQGIAPQLLASLFERPGREDAAMNASLHVSPGDVLADADGHATVGWGLVISRELVELHGGRVRAESPGLGPGLGARFFVTLPLAAGS